MDNKIRVFKGNRVVYEEEVDFTTAGEDLFNDGKRTIGGYIAFLGMEVAPNEYLSKDCEITFPDSFHIKDASGKVILEGTIFKGEKGIELKGTIK